MNETHAVRELSVYELADWADCGTPDNSDSAGAVFLRGVLDAVIEAHDNGELDDDSDHDIADAAVPIYTHRMWQTFVDLSAWQEDISDYGCDLSEGLEKAAMVALYMIAQRLTAQLIADLDRTADTADLS